MTAHGYRVVLSGTGGDEFTGGVPTPIPELQDLLSRAQFAKLAHRLKIWALHKKQPWLGLLWQAARGFLPPSLFAPEQKFSPPWLKAVFVRRNYPALAGYATKVKLFGALPTFQENLDALDALRRQLACQALPSEPCHEKRYPYLDRSLLEFLSGIPREQLVRPGQRRSLMRRALIGIVPPEILNKRRKAYVCRTPLAAAFSEWSGLTGAHQSLVGCTFGFFDRVAISEAFERARQGHVVPVVTLIRTLGIEFWLRGLAERGVLRETSAIFAQHSSLASSRVEGSV
jgi:asparagine synthase (glutamine-hydrolysing)